MWNADPVITSVIVADPLWRVFRLGMPIVMAVAALLRLWCAAKSTALRAGVEIHFTGVIAFDAGRDFLQTLIGAVP